MATNQNTAPAGPSWQVTGQQEASEVNDLGQVDKVMRVMFRLSTGQQASVSVPLATYSADTVRAAIAAKAATLAAVADLTG